jgi:hypothetical protein
MKKMKSCEYGPRHLTLRVILQICIVLSKAGASLKHFLGAPLEGKLIALSTNVRLDWKDLPRTSTLAYYGRRKFYSIGPWMSLQATKLSL